MGKVSDFKQAIALYGFPRSEPIFYFDLTLGAQSSASADTECLLVFRPSGQEADWHRSVEEFWASALFNFLEDRVEEHKFEEMGAAGEYRALTDDETHRMLSALIGTAASDNIALPTDVTSCFLVYDDDELKALVGIDSAGFFAVIWEA